MTQYLPETLDDLYALLTPPEALGGTQGQPVQDLFGGASVDTCLDAAGVLWVSGFVAGSGPYGLSDGGYLFKTVDGQVVAHRGPLYGGRVSMTLGADGLSVSWPGGRWVEAEFVPFWMATGDVLTPDDVAAMIAVQFDALLAGDLNGPGLAGRFARRVRDVVYQALDNTRSGVWDRIWVVLDATRLRRPTE